MKLKTAAYHFQDKRRTISKIKKVMVSLRNAHLFQKDESYWNWANVTI